MIETIISIALISFLLFYFSFNLDKKHFLLKLFIAFFVFFLIILIPKQVINNDYCGNEISNITVSGNLTTYKYSLVCNERESVDGLNFYKYYMFFLKFFAIYLIVYLSYEVLNYMGKFDGIKKKIKYKKENGR